MNLCRYRQRRAAVQLEGQVDSGTGWPSFTKTARCSQHRRAGRSVPFCVEDGGVEANTETPIWGIVFETVRTHGQSILHELGPRLPIVPRDEPRERRVRGFCQAVRQIKNRAAARHYPGTFRSALILNRSNQFLDGPATPFFSMNFLPPSPSMKSSPYFWAVECQTFIQAWRWPEGDREALRTALRDAGVTLPVCLRRGAGPASAVPCHAAVCAGRSVPAGARRSLPRIAVRLR